MSVQMELSADEEQAYKQIVSAGEMVQSELWKALDASSRKGSRLASSLADKGLIDREQTVYEGRVTYLLTPTEQAPPSTSDSDSTPEKRTRENATTEADHNHQPSPTEGDLTTQEQRALALIGETGTLYQSELWKELDVSSRTGTRIAISLEEKGLVQRHESVYNGHNTYLLELPAKDRDFSLLMAGNEISPFIDSDVVDPQSSVFSQWLLQLEQETSTRNR